MFAAQLRLRLRRFPHSPAGGSTEPLPMMFYVTGFWGSWICLGALLRLLSGPKKFLHAKEYLELPECAVDPVLGSHHTVEIQTSDCGKLKIKYVAKGDKSKPLMLLLHGFPETWYSWRFQLKEFCDQFRVVAIDTRGYGDSDKPSGLEHYALENLVEDIPALIKALGYESATVVGHDWGGAITWLFATYYPEMCDSVIILNCPHPIIHRQHLSSSFKQFLASWYMFYFLLPYLPEVVMRSNDFAMLAATLRGRKGGVKNRENMTPQDLDVFKYALNSWEARNAAHNYIRANFKYNTSFRRGNSSGPRPLISVPMLILWGTGDLFLTKQLAESSAKQVSDCKLIFVEGASHWVQQDRPQEVNQHIREFLAKKLSKL